MKQKLASVLMALLLLLTLPVHAAAEQLDLGGAIPSDVTYYQTVHDDFAESTLPAAYQGMDHTVYDWQDWPTPVTLGDENWLCFQKLANYGSGIVRTFAPVSGEVAIRFYFQPADASLHAPLTLRNSAGDTIAQLSIGKAEILQAIYLDEPDGSSRALNNDGAVADLLDNTVYRLVWLINTWDGVQTVYLNNTKILDNHPLWQDTADVAALQIWLKFTYQNTPLYLSDLRVGYAKERVLLREPLAGPIGVTVDGTPLDLAVAPCVVGNRILVPARALLEHLGASVLWDETTASVAVVAGDRHAAFSVGAHMGYVNGRVVPFVEPPQIIEGVTMVPMRMIAEALGCRVAWDAEADTVVITT